MGFRLRDDLEEGGDHEEEGEHQLVRGEGDPAQAGGGMRHEAKRRDLAHDERQHLVRVGVGVGVRVGVGVGVRVRVGVRVGVRVRIRVRIRVRVQVRVQVKVSVRTGSAKTRKERAW